MGLLDNLFNKDGHKEVSLSKDQVAEMLKTSPEALAAFERSYQTHVLADETPDGFLHTSAKQAKDQARTIPADEGVTGKAFDQAVVQASAMVDQIVDELLAETPVYYFDGDLSKPAARSWDMPKKALPGRTEITNAVIKTLPTALRPQCTADAAIRDTPPGDTASALLWQYKRFTDMTLPESDRKMAYHMFRQGLDILDLDAITYEILSMNQNSMSHWLPALVEACRGNTFFKIPATRIAKVPLTLLQMTRLDYESLTQTTRAIIDRWAFKAFQLDEAKDYFVKTGTYSSKFDFRNAHVHGAKEVRELGEYLAYIQYQATMMAGPLVQPSTYGISTTNEWVVRDFIPDKENNPTIYKGLPLHTEYRIFIDCDKDILLGFTPYWEPETMKKRFGHGSDANSPHQMHDYVIYKAHEETLTDRFYASIDLVLQEIERIISKLNLKGQWSLDVMQNGSDFWLIDMALAENSAFYADCVPPTLQNPTEENWLPTLPKADTEDTHHDD